MICPHPHLRSKTLFLFARVYLARGGPKLGQSLTFGSLELRQSLHVVRTIGNSKAGVARLYNVDQRQKWEIRVWMSLLSWCQFPSVCPDSGNLPLPCILSILLFPF